MRSVAMIWPLLAATICVCSAAEPEPGSQTIVLNEQTHWRFVAAYRPPGATPENKAKARWVRWGDECQSPLPPGNWMQPDFDDAGWPRTPGEVFGGHGGAMKADVALLCLRTRFGVGDPAAVKDLKLTLKYRGGAVVYLNGREIARQHLPKRQLNMLSKADAYPDEVVDLPSVRGRERIDPKLAGRYDTRIRHLTATLPAAALKKGTNVLAVELHWSANAATNWNTAGLVGAALTAAAGSDVQPNTGGGDGVQVWTANPLLRPEVDVFHGDPFEPQCVRLLAPINGFASGQVVVSSDKELPPLTAKMSDLSARQDKLPASAVRIRYVQLGEGFNALLDKPAGPAKTQAIWLTAKVPADVKPGKYAYEGELTIEGLQEPRTVHLVLSVFDWKLGDPKDWKTVVNLLQSPESVAGHYKVPLWSERHFQLLEKSFALMGAAGNDVLGVSAVAKTVFGNDPLIVFKRQGDRWTPEFKFLDRYLELYNRHAAAPQFLSLQVFHYGMYSRGFGRDGGAAEKYAETIPVMELQGDKLVPAELPMYGRPGTEELWRQVLDGIRERIEKLGWRDARILLGTSGDNWVGPRIVDTFKKAAPYAQWRAITHGSGCPKWGVTDAERTQPNGMVVGYLEMARRIAFNREPVPEHPRTCNARDCLGGKDPFAFRSLAPCNCTHARYEGFCWKGLDYWEYATAEGTTRRALNTYVQFGNVVGSTPRTLAMPGPDGAVATVQYEMLREGIQDTEAIWLIRAALADPQRRERLGETFAQRAAALIEEVGDVYELGLRAGPQGAADVRSLIIRLYVTAGAVAAATN